MLDRLDDIEKRFEEIELELQDPRVSSNPKELQRLGKARRELEAIVAEIRAYRKSMKELADASELLTDPEFKDVAQEEVERLRIATATHEENLRLMLLPKDPNDDKSVIVEIRAAAGGEEAKLFAYELFRMYTRYAERRKWKYEVIDIEETGIGGTNYVCFSINADGAYSQLKHESGVHRVQRVPATESSGRLQTSTATVAVMPEAEESDIDIRDQDLEITTFRSSSAGGQHMQKNETAIRIVHIPTGTVVTCQDERSQQQNKLRALSVLRSKIQEADLERIAKERGDLRKGQIGSGDRSEKIRTYHFIQNRVTDHRIGLDIFDVGGFLDGDLQKMIDALVAEHQARLLADAGDAAARG